MAETTIRDLTAATEPLAGSELIELDVGAGVAGRKAALYTVNNSRIYSTAASYTITDTDGYTDFLIKAAAATIDFDIPTAAANVGRKLFFKLLDSGAGTITFTFEGGEDECGVSVLANKGAFLWIESDGTDWYILNHRDIHNTGWINAAAGLQNKDFVITHNLNKNMSDIIIDFSISSDGAEANAIKLPSHQYSVSNIGETYFQDSITAFHIQTGSGGLSYLADATGNIIVITANTWYYKCVVRSEQT